MQWDKKWMKDEKKPQMAKKEKEYNIWNCTLQLNNVKTHILVFILFVCPESYSFRGFSYVARDMEIKDTPRRVFPQFKLLW